MPSKLIGARLRGEDGWSWIVGYTWLINVHVFSSLRCMDERMTRKKERTEAQWGLHIYTHWRISKEERERSNTSFVSIRINSQRPTNRRILIWLEHYFLSLSLSRVLLSSSDEFVQWCSLLSRVGGFAWTSIFLSLALFCSTEVHRFSWASLNVYFQRPESAADVSINSELKNKDNVDVKVQVRASRQLVDRKFSLERMRRWGTQNNGHLGGNSEFHLDVPPLPVWQNNSMPPPPSHIQLLPTTINGHHIGNEHLINSGNEQMDRKSIADSFLCLCDLCCHPLESNYFPSFIYPSTVQASSFDSNGTVYFTHAPPLMPTTPQTAQGPPNTLPTGAHFSQFHPGRTFDNSNRHSFHQPAHFQPSPPSLFQMPSPPPSMAPHLQAPSEDIAMELPPRFRRPKAHDQENQFSQPRPMSGDFDRFRNGHFPSSNYNLRSNNDHRAPPRPQSFYDFSSPSSSNTNNNNNFTRPPNNTRYQRNTNNTCLPLSAYMNTDDSTHSNDNGNRHQHWGTSYQRRRPVNPPRTYQQDKHQFPLSLYDPRQYGFSNQSGKRAELSERANPNDIDLIEAWWEDNNTNTTELIATDPVTETVDSHPTTTTVNDSGNSSLSTSINLKESTLDDEEENNLSANDFISPPSDVSTTDSKSNSSLTDREIFSSVRSSGVIIESLDKLQQELKLEEALDKHLASADDQSSDKDLSLLLNNEVGVGLVWFADHCRRTFVPIISQTTTYDTAHFLQWAKDKFREELAGRLTAQVGWQWAWNDNWLNRHDCAALLRMLIRFAWLSETLFFEQNRIDVFPDVLGDRTTRCCDHRRWRWRWSDPSRSDEQVHFRFLHRRRQ